MLNSAYNRIEYSVRKGEIDGYQHFLLFLQCFLMLASSSGRLTLYHTIPTFMDHEKVAF